jgi:predicted ribosome quality control (RQC) complex YloA/Tae2 family protein
LHNSCFLVGSLAKELNEKLTQSKWIESFAQNPEELVCIIALSNLEAFYLHVYLGNIFTCLHFPNTFKRATHNTSSYFTELNGLKVLSVKAVDFDRALVINLEKNHQIIFAMYGLRANVWTCRDEVVINFFKPKLSKIALDIQGKIAPAPNLSYERFDAFKGDVKSFFPALGKDADAYLSSIRYEQKTRLEQYNTFQNILQYLTRSPKFYLIKRNEQYGLSLFKEPEICGEYVSAIEALQAIYTAHFKYNLPLLLKQKLQLAIAKNIKELKTSLIKHQDQLTQLQSARPLHQIADIIMASISTNIAHLSVHLFHDFYQNKTLPITKPPKLSWPEYAGTLYKKSKNSHLAIERLNQLIDEKNSQLATLEMDEEKVSKLSIYKDLSSYAQNYLEPKKDKKHTETVSLFHEYHMLGYKIWVGKNAKNNDKLTLHHAHKNDLWLHAKDVSGSHVIIKYKSGEVFPKPVIAFAAQLAAYFSKRKTDSLCPVIYTPKKYVRKPKGYADGAVKVEKESVMMVVPSKP